MSMKICLIRHGETYWNVSHKMQGQVNIPLSPKGREQATAAASLLRGMHIDVCYTSPLSRARDTAVLALAGRDVPIFDEPLLMEQNYGLSEGKNQHIGFHNPFSPLFYYNRPEKYRPAIGGETFDDLAARSRMFISSVLLAQEERFETVLVSAHGAIICSILGEMLQIPRTEFWSVKLGNCEFKTVFLSNGQFFEQSPIPPLQAEH